MAANSSPAGPIAAAERGGGRDAQTETVAPATESNTAETTDYSWDVFQINARERSAHALDYYYEFSKKLLKVAAYVVLFFIILATVVISKTTLFVITSNIRHGQRVDCTITDSYSKVCYNATTCSYDNTTLSVCTLVDSRPRIRIAGPPTDMENSMSTDSPFNGTTTPTQEHAVYISASGQRYAAEITRNVRYVHLDVCEAVTARWMWALALCVLIPYLHRFLKCLWRVIFKSQQNKRPKIGHVPLIIAMVAIECVQTFGLCLFVFIVLPRLDAIRGLLLTPAVAFIPSILRIFLRPKYENNTVVHIVLDVLAALVQTTALFMWTVVDKPSDLRESGHFSWALPVSLMLISLSWLPNFVMGSYIIKGKQEGSRGNEILDLWADIHYEDHYHLYLFVSLAKIVMTIMSLIVITHLENHSIKLLFDFSAHQSECAGKAFLDVLQDMDRAWMIIVAVHAVVSLWCFVAALRLCKINMDKLSLAVPLSASLLVTFTVFISACRPEGQLFGLLPGYAEFACPDPNKSLWSDSHVWIGFFWWLSFLWITSHIWFKSDKRLERSQRIFSSPMYCSVVLDQDIALNRLKEDTTVQQGIRKKSTSELVLTPPKVRLDRSMIVSTSSLSPEIIPMIYVCATMWHESEKEMVQVLKSIFRLDEDQSARRNAYKISQQFNLDYKDPDFYELECHIMFDDAFEEHGESDIAGFAVNSFVKQLVQAVTTAGRYVHNVEYDVTTPPVRSFTPYGGRLEWMLPGGNRLVAHLKDKTKIRHKKRWSQVMYFYYILAHKLLGENTTDVVNQLRAGNTYILALDGDVDFQPPAVHRLLDLMQRNERVGAACGRIHPTGSGPMVWYQKFEYAVGHWLQKATEHVLGCVMCSPGCFSLYRASAMMDENVIRAFAANSTRPTHYVQYDQGEDRWLCTLLLQQGYRVEYCAAADAMTFAPESFEEFYNQRKRWMPSTMANLWDLLQSCGSTVRINDDISFLYILYQSAMLASAVLGPGTIFIMIVGALQAINFGFDLQAAILVNVIPIAFYIVLCMTSKQRTQVYMAGLLSALYAVVMMLVLIGTALSIQEKGFCSPAAIFLLIVAGIFIVAGLLHPREILCLLHGALYFITIPSMYLILNIYAFSNLHKVSWGTREIPKSSKKRKLAQTNSSKEKTMGIFHAKREDDDDGWTLSVGSFFRFTCCPRDSRSVSEKKYDGIMTRFDNLEKSLGIGGNVELEEGQFDSAGSARSTLISRTLSINRHTSGGSINVDQSSDFSQSMVSWIDDPDLGSGSKVSLFQQEDDFWRQIIAKYLHPLTKDINHEEKVSIQLTTLRNKFMLGFIMFNLMYVVIVCTLQAHVRGVHSSITLEWPCLMNNNFTFELEPIGLVFIVFFCVLLMLQFIGMLLHRRETFWHIIATTFLSKQKHQGANFIALAKRMQRLEREDSSVVDSRAASTTSLDQSFVDSAAAGSTSSLVDEAQKPDGVPVVSKREGIRRKVNRKRRHRVKRMESLEAAFRSRLSTLDEDLNRDDLDDDVKETRRTFRTVVGRQMDENKRKSEDALEYVYHTYTLARQGTRSAAASPEMGTRRRTYSEDLVGDEDPSLMQKILKPLRRGVSAPNPSLKGKVQKRHEDEAELEVVVISPNGDGNTPKEETF